METPREASPATRQPSTEGWTLVSRRRRPAHFLPRPLSQPNQTRTLNPCSPTYAQALLNTPPLQVRAPMGLKPSQAAAKNPTPPHSLQSPIHLPYPPNPHQKEWWGRCFRCTRKGHVVAECTFPRTVPTYAAETQTIRSARPPLQLVQTHSHLVQPVQPSLHPVCSQTSPSRPPPQLVQTHSQLVQPVQPFSHPVHSHPQLSPPSPVRPSSQTLLATSQSAQIPADSPSPLFLPANHLRLSTPDPGFDEFLTAPEPQDQPLMPLDRPPKVLCYFNRDPQYLQILHKLLKGIVIQPPAYLHGRLNLDQAAQTIATSAKVSSAQLQVAALTGDRFLVLLPDSIDRDEVVTAIPRSFWDNGYRFHAYSPLMDANVSIPSFKIWIDLHGVPLELSSDAHLARAVASFGTFLGSMEPQKTR